MQTIQIHLPENILKYLEKQPQEQESFVLDAIREKIEREKRKKLRKDLIEGYLANREEDLEIID